MLVRMLTNTNYRGFKEIGNEYEVPSDVALRWQKNGIALGIAEVIPTNEIEPEIIGQIEIEEIEETEEIEEDLSDLSSKELYDICIKQGLEVEQKKARKYYLDALANI